MSKTVVSGPIEGKHYNFVEAHEGMAEGAGTIALVEGLIAEGEAEEVWADVFIEALAAAPLHVYGRCRGQLREKFGKKIGLTVLDKAVQARRMKLQRAAELAQPDAVLVAGDDGRELMTALRGAMGTRWFLTREVAEQVRAGTVPARTDSTRELGRTMAGLAGAQLVAGLRLERGIDPRTKAAKWRITDVVDNKVEERQ